MAGKKQTHCHKDHVLSAENVYIASSGRRRCKLCTTRFNTAWKTANLAKVKRFYQLRYAARRKLVDKLKQAPCLDCKRTYPTCVMDFDHVRGTKKFGVAAGMTSESTDAIVAEIAKCDLVCANCHRIRTHQRRRNKFE